MLKNANSIMPPQGVLQQGQVSVKEGDKVTLSKQGGSFSLIRKRPLYKPTTRSISEQSLPTDLKNLGSAEKELDRSTSQTSFFLNVVGRSVRLFSSRIIHVYLLKGNIQQREVQPAKTRLSL